jgi:hypothetical protein
MRPHQTRHPGAQGREQCIHNNATFLIGRNAFKRATVAGHRAQRRCAHLPSGQRTDGQIEPDLRGLPR